MASIIMHPSERAVNVLISYVAGKKKTDYGGRELVTYINCTGTDTAAQFVETKRMWTAITGINKGKGRSCYHGFMSFAPGEVDPETAHRLTVKLAKTLWGARFEIVVATHTDTDYVHSHFVINSVSIKDGRKMKYASRQLFEMIEEANSITAGISSPYRLKAVKKMSYAEHAATKNGKLTLREIVKRDVDRAVAASVTEKEFLETLRGMGYDILTREKDGKPLTKPILRPKGWRGWFGFHTLAPEGYSMPELRERISRNYHRSEMYAEEELEEIRKYREKKEPARGEGIRALYLRYLFELGILEKWPSAVRSIPPGMITDMIKPELLRAELKFAEDKGLDVKEKVEGYRNERTQIIGKLREEQKILKARKNRLLAAGDVPAYAEMSAVLAKRRKRLQMFNEEIRLCNRILGRGDGMERSLEQIDKVRTDILRKEERTDERELGSGGPGREDDAGRN